ncbi:hypothetical protein Q7I21_17475 [Aeromonas veronii]|uniref:hypothetical protein n=1 Tax=Aeromonas veronii TaxID=654 RepID=UPI003007CBB0
MKWTDVSVHASKITNASGDVLFLTSDDIINAPRFVEEARACGRQIITIPSVVKDKLSGQIDVEGNKIQDLSHFVSEWNDSFEFKFIQPDMLTKAEYSIFNMTHKIASLVGGLPANVKDIKVSETMRSEFGGFSEACGLWTGTEIIIKRSELVSIERYSATLLHEVAHARSGESDITIGFELELSSLLGMVASKALHGSYDSNKIISDNHSLSSKKKGFWARLFS